VQIRHALYDEPSLFISQALHRLKQRRPQLRISCRQEDWRSEGAEFVAAYCG